MSACVFRLISHLLACHAFLNFVYSPYPANDTGRWAYGICAKHITESYNFRHQKLHIANFFPLFLQICSARFDIVSFEYFYFFLVLFEFYSLQCLFFRFLFLSPIPSAFCLLFGYCQLSSPIFRFMPNSAPLSLYCCCFSSSFNFLFLLLSLLLLSQQTLSPSLLPCHHRFFPRSFDVR